MSELSRFFGIVIAIFARGEERHHRAHIHVFVTRDEEYASIALDNGEVLNGRLHPTHLKLVKAWMKLNKAELNAAWAKISHGENPGKIPPLVFRKGNKS
jgi:hypothetical protein